MSEQFHIPSGWAVLVVEDTEDRIAWFRQRLPKAVFAKNAETAFQVLSEHEFKAAFLDHDRPRLVRLGASEPGWSVSMTISTTIRYLRQRCLANYVITPIRHGSQEIFLVRLHEESKAQQQSNGGAATARRRPQTPRRLIQLW
jgi:CheY-like chemotaxis protein